MKYLTVVSNDDGDDLIIEKTDLDQRVDEFLPKVFGKVFSKSLAMSGSLRRAFMSSITCSTAELVNVRHSGVGRMYGRASGPVELLP